MAPALLRQATYGSLKLGFYHALKRRLVKNPKGMFYAQRFEVQELIKLPLIFEADVVRVSVFLYKESYQSCIHEALFWEVNFTDHLSSNSKIKLPKKTS